MYKCGKDMLLVSKDCTSSTCLEDTFVCSMCVYSIPVSQLYFDQYYQSFPLPVLGGHALKPPLTQTSSDFSLL